MPYAIGDTITCLVTRPKGSWKWQDAYAISTWRVEMGSRGRAIWAFCGRSKKHSLPQLREVECQCVGRPRNSMIANKGE